MFRSILVPLDGSVFGEHALSLALEVVRRAGAVLYPAHVYRPSEPWRDFESITPYRFEGEVANEAEYEQEERARERAYLTGVARLAGEHGIQAAPALLDGDVADALERHAEETAADLVVMTTRGRGRLNRPRIGSVADTVLRALAVPVLLVRPDDGVRADPSRPPVLENLLVPLDGSAAAEAVLAPATELGRLWDARCTLITVVPPGGSTDRVTPAAHYEDEEPTTERDSHTAHAYLERVADRVRKSWSRVDARVIEEASTASAILDTAGRLEGGAIAMTTNGRSGLTRLLHGSVADEVVHAATTPVLIHRPPSTPS